MPTKPESKALTGGSPAILNAIRATASLDYQDRIPVATQDNIKEIGNAMMSFSAMQNEFLTALVNRIGLVIIQSKLYQNPLSEFKRGLMELGETVEEIFVDIVKAHPFNQETAEKEVFKREIPDVQAVFHRVNSELFYKTTVSQAQLRRAFLSNSGVEDLVNSIIEVLYSSANFDEFISMKQVIRNYGDNGLFYPVNIVNPTNDVTARQALVTVREWVNNLTFMSRKYNSMGVATFTPKTDQIIFINTHFDALVDVEALAYAFNMSKADFEARKVVLDDFGGLSDIVCMLVDKRWFMTFDNALDFESIYNPEGKYWNYWLHKWTLYSSSPFANAIVFTTATPSVTSVTVSPATETVTKGRKAEFDSTVVTTGHAPQTVNWTLTGNTSTKTVVDLNGTVFVDDSETATSITVTATSTFDSTKAGTATLTVTP